MHDSQTPHGSPSTRSAQLSALAYAHILQTSSLSATGSQEGYVVLAGACVGEALYATVKHGFETVETFCCLGYRFVVQYVFHTAGFFVGA